MSEHVNVEQELVTATNFVPEKKYRKRQDFLGALMRAVCDLTDEEFGNLSDEAADWSDKAVAAFKKDEPLPDFVSGNGVDHELDGEVQGHAVEDDSTEHSASPEDDGSGEPSQGEQTETEKPAKKKPGRPKGKSKGKVAKAPKEKKVRVPPRGNNPWGVSNGSHSDTVCRMLAQEGGTTMKDIIEATGHARYNVINRLARHGYKIVKDGHNIRMIP